MYKFNIIKELLFYFVIVLIYIYIIIIIFNKVGWIITYEKNDDICMKEKLYIYKNLEIEMAEQEKKISFGFTSKSIFKDSVINLLQKMDNCHRTNNAIKMSQVKFYQTKSFMFSVLFLPMYFLLIFKIYKLMKNYSYLIF
uniref:GOLD domain-containing protein n=1 Tax=Strongyloides stercoralis TaxID=6248 RepID=A0A0K0ED79_STRER